MRLVTTLALAFALGVALSQATGVGIGQLALAMATECVADATCSAKYVATDAATLAADFELVLASHGLANATAAELASIPLSPSVLLGLATDLDVTCVDSALYASSKAQAFMMGIMAAVTTFAVVVFVALFVLIMLRTNPKKTI